MSIYSFFCRGNKTIFKLQSNPCFYFFKSAHGKKETFSIISTVNKINRGKITKEGNQFGFELFEGYPGWVSRRFFLSPGVRRIEVDCQPAITSGSRNRGLPFEKLGMISPIWFGTWTSSIINYSSVHSYSPIFVETDVFFSIFKKIRVHV